MISFYDCPLTPLDLEREARIHTLGALICSPAATRLWRIVCHVEQRQLIRGRSPRQIARMERDLNNQLPFGRG